MKRLNQLLNHNLSELRRKKRKKEKKKKEGGKKKAESCMMLLHYTFLQESVQF